MIIDKRNKSNRTAVHRNFYYAIANKTDNIAENIVFVRTFRPSTGAMVNADDQIVARTE